MKSTVRVPNKGMEGLALTPNGRTLVGMLQTATIEDTNAGGAGANLLRWRCPIPASARGLEKAAFHPLHRRFCEAARRDHGRH